MANTYYAGGVGARAKMAIGVSGGSFTTMDFVEFTPGIVKNYSDGSVRSMRGSLDHNSICVTEGLLHVRFRTRFWMTAAKLVALLPCLGFSNGGSGDTWTIQDAIPQSTMIFTPDGSPDNTFTGIMPSDFVIAGQKGGDPVFVDIGWVGSGWTQQTNGTYNYGSLVDGYPYAFGITANTGYAATLTLGSPYSLTLAMPQVRIQMNYKLAIEYNNSTTSTNILPTDHELTVSTSVLYDTSSGFTSLVTKPLGVPSSVVPDTVGCTFNWNLQNQAGGSSNQTQIAIANVKPMARFPRIVKNDFNRLPVNFLAFATNSTASMIITNVSSGV
jgi:hypothetical protein